MHSEKSVSGVITILISLMMIGILSLGTMIIEASRLQAAKTQLADANISAATSMIAAYDNVLYERYGLLAIDEELSNEARCRDYLNFNSDLSSGYAGNNLSRMYQINSVEMNGLYNLTHPGILKRQILTRAKYNMDPTNPTFNYDIVSSNLIELQKKCRLVVSNLEPVANGQINAGSKEDLTPQLEAAFEELFYTFCSMKKMDEGCNTILNDNTEALLPSRTETVNSDAPNEDIQGISNTVSDIRAVLGTVGKLNYEAEEIPELVDVTASISDVSGLMSLIGDVESISDITGNTKAVAGICVSLAKEIDEAISMYLLPGDNQVAAMESNMLLNSYIALYFSNRNRTMEGYMGPERGAGMHMDDANFVAASTEYVFGGKPSEEQNQSIAYDYIMAIRLIDNLSIIIPNPIADSNAYTAMILLARAYYETCADMELLTNYKADVPLQKYSLLLPIDNPSAIRSAFSSRNISNAFSALGINVSSEEPAEGGNQTTYSDYLALGLWFVPNSQKLKRIADIIQLEMRYREVHINQEPAKFLMSNKNTFCRVKVTANLNAILPVISVGPDSRVDGTTFQSIKYVGY